MKDHYFIYALMVLAVILALMVVGATIYIGVLQGENEAFKEENQRLERRVDEIRALTDRIEELMRDVNDSEDWNKEAYHE